MIRLEKQRRRVLLALALVAPCAWAAGANRKNTWQTGLSTVNKATPHRPTTRSKRSSASRRRRRTRRNTLAQLRLEPGRVKQIQQALAEAGYFRGDLSGAWDDQTREAIRRYQADNGFPTTGLPEAKTLMKLGLGPHPLPEDLEPGGAARGGNESGAYLRPPPIESQSREVPRATDRPHRN